MSATTCPGCSRSTSNGSSSVPMPIDVALTTMSQSATASGRPTTPIEPASAAAPVGPVRRAVDDRDRRRAGAGDGVDDRPSRAAAAEHADPHAGDLDAVGSQRGDEAGTIGAVPLEPTVADRHDGVDAAQRGGRRVELVDQRGHGLLVRHGDRQTTEAQHAHRLEGCAGIAAARPRTPRTPSRARWRRSRRCAAPATGCGARGCRSRRPAWWWPRSPSSSPRSRACCTLTSCCSSVAANTWRPSSSATT